MFDPERRAASRQLKAQNKAEKERKRQIAQQEAAAKYKAMHEAEATRRAKELEPLAGLSVRMRSGSR